MSTINEIHLKCDVIDGSLVKGLRQTKLDSFTFETLPGYKVFCQVEPKHYKIKQICF